MQAFATAVLAVLLLTGCGHEPVAPSALPPATVAPVPGPTYAEIVMNGKPHVAIHTPTRTTRIPRASGVFWRADGSVLVIVDGFVRLLQPATGRWTSPAVRGSEGSTGVTPEGLTTLTFRHPDRVVIWDADLRRRRTITVPASRAESDQIGEDAQFRLHGDPYTLGGVTWVEWGVNSEDETRTDHGLFRIEGSRITQALRNKPLVRLLPSRDGSALLAVMQDNGDDEDCGGCQVDQTLVELDPASGEITADYGTPPGYDENWRIGAVDKVGGKVAVQYVVRTGESGGSYQTWSYDGSWSRVSEAGDTRTRFQQGGALTWAGDTGEQHSPFELAWTTSTGQRTVLRERRTPCPTDRTGWTACPTISMPGSIVPPTRAGSR